MKRIVFFCLFVVLIFCTSCSSKDDPYTRFKGNDLHLKSGDKELFWFSCIHTNDPEHEMFDDIENQFNSFKPDYVLVEGNFNRNTYGTELDAKLEGESAYATFLANKSNIEIGSIEPPYEMQIQLLLKTYEEDDILAMYILRQISQIQRESQNVDIDFFEYMVPYTQNMITKDFTYSYMDIDNDFIVRILEPHIETKVDNDNWKKISAGSIVYNGNGLIHSIYNDVRDYRDTYSVNLISNKLKKYNRIFIMMGADHIKAQEEDLRKLFNDME